MGFTENLEVRGVVDRGLGWGEREKSLVLDAGHTLPRVTTAGVPRLHEVTETTHTPGATVTGL